ncbi:MAG: hypothetical protein EKK48_10630 [Candidatus Melainabacteria bacterium]|nr:MAG: hypothetical protein EKK48_10630 [Candidatus Melainabacteria bacterium]
MEDYFSVLGATLVLLLTAGCLEVKASNSVDLKHAAISGDAIDKLATGQSVHMNSADEYICQGSANRVVPLLRPDGNGIVAIVAISSNEKTAILNPSGIDYGEIPPLTKLTPAQADQLWGSKSDAQQGLQRTYKLSSKWNQHFLIDLSFKNEQLEKYRIRSPLLRAPDWKLVH